jgi:lysozyme family protein
MGRDAQGKRMSNLSKIGFIERFKNKSLDLEPLADHPNFPSHVREKISSADLNKDGSVSGAAEWAGFFKNLDQYDNNGSSQSIRVSQGGEATALGRIVESLDAAVRDATPAERAASVGVPQEPYGSVYRNHQTDAANIRLSTGGSYDVGVRSFQDTWANHQHRYQAVAEQTGVPAALIAALHYRESSSRFDTYLHQGDPLGQPAIHHPSDIPVFYQWEDAAVHALNSKSWLRDELGMHAGTTDKASLATFAEAYNGLGYHYRGLTSPYVYAGTDVYKGGRYVADGVFDSSSWDQRPGVMALLVSTEGSTEEVQWTPSQGDSESWNQVLTGNNTLRDGVRGPAVRLVQEKLQSMGYRVAVDGVFGRQTQLAVMAFQTHQQLSVDGRVGPQTAGALDGLTQPTPEPEPEHPVAVFMENHPEVETAQDFINFCYRRGGGTWVAAKEMAEQYGLNLNDLARSRQTSLSAWAS